MLARTHSSHQGAEACIRQVRDVIFWPGIVADIKEMVSHCEVCSKFICTQQREPLMTYCPGSLHLQRKRLSDYYSDFREVDLFPNTISETVIQYTKAHFVRYGIPEIVVSW